VLGLSLIAAAIGGRKSLFNIISFELAAALAVLALAAGVRQ
jgi:hypothetical protein